MALIKKQYVCSKEEYEHRGKPKYYYFRIGELLTFKDPVGNVFMRFKDYRIPDRPFVIFDEDKNPNDKTH